MDAELEGRLRELLDKQEIREVILRYARAQERRDARLLASVFHDDAIYEHFELPPQRGSDAIAALTAKAWAGSPLKTKGLTIPNTVTEVEGDVAFSESHGLSLNPVEQEGERFDYLRSLRFLDRLERRDGVWKIAHRLVLHGGYERWEPGAPAPFAAAASPELRSAYHPDDLSYRIRERLRPEAVADRTTAEKPIYAQEPDTA
ncbi:hypothetical protein GCM10022224_103140 [Nonomuraea antimicrobica]|uniref:SnoaL-like domain-containing protein n=1 Tax=Nonomuraea antimicrobica TaxID=561173 RepID=A0ABP7EMI6_9ACTN